MPDTASTSMHGDAAPVPAAPSLVSQKPLIRRGIFYTLVAVLLIIAALAHFWDELSIWRLHSRAAELSESSHDLEAIDHLRSALRIDRDNPVTVLKLASFHRRAGQLGEAMRLLSAAQELGADSKQIELERTLLDVQTGRIHGFDQTFAQWMVDMPEHAPDIMQSYVLGLFANLQTQKAFQLLGSWEASSPQDPRPKFLQAYLYQSIDRLDLAANAYRAGLKLANDSSLMRRRLGQVLLDAGKTEEALVELKQCLEASPGDVEVHYLLAQGAQQQNQLEAASQELEQVLTADPNHFDALRLRGQIYLDKGEPQAALADLEQAASAHPDDTVAREALGRALQALGRTDEAKRHFEFVAASTKLQGETARLIRQVLTEPQNAELRFEIGVRLLQSGNVEDGAKWLRTVFEIQPNHTDAHLALASILEMQGDYRNAAMHRELSKK